MAGSTRKPKIVKRKVEESLGRRQPTGETLETRRARMMVLGVETGRSDLQEFFEQCLKAHAIDTLKELE